MEQHVTEIQDEGHGDPRLLFLGKRGVPPGWLEMLHLMPTAFHSTQAAAVAAPCQQKGCAWVVA